MQKRKNRPQFPVGVCSNTHSHIRREAIFTTIEPALTPSRHSRCMGMSGSIHVFPCDRIRQTYSSS